MSEEQLTRENEALKAKLEAALKSKSGHTVTNKYIPPNQDFANTVHKKVVTIVWDDVKFVDDTNYLTYTKKVFRKLDDYENTRKLPKPELEAQIMNFHKDYGPQCVKSLNEHRSSRQTELKSIFDKHTKMNEDEPNWRWPSADFWFKIALRENVMPVWQDVTKTIDGVEKTVTVQKNPRFDWFEVHWEELMKVVCCANTWGVHSRHYNLMSSAKRPSDLDKAPNKQRALVTVSNEAFLILSLENNEERWPWHNDWVKQHPGKKPPKKETANKPKFSHPTGGPSFYGSWQDEGRVRFIELMDKIGKNRTMFPAKVKAADGAMLEYLREKHGISEKEANKKKKRKRNEPAPQITSVDFDDSDDEAE